MTGLTAPDRYTVVARTSQPAGYAETAVAIQSASILDHLEVDTGATHRATLVTSRDQTHPNSETGESNPQTRI